MEPFNSSTANLKDKVPYIELSEKELKIQDARKAWKKVRDEAEKLRLAYKEEKGDFYKKK